MAFNLDSHIRRLAERLQYITAMADITQFFFAEGAEPSRHAAFVERFSSKNFQRVSTPDVPTATPVMVLFRNVAKSIYDFLWRGVLIFFSSQRNHYFETLISPPSSLPGFK